MNYGYDQRYNAARNSIQTIDATKHDSHRDSQRGLCNQLSNDDGYFESMLLGIGIMLVLLLGSFMVIIHLPEEPIPEKSQIAKLVEKPGDMEIANDKIENSTVSNMNSVIRDLHYKIKECHKDVDSIADTEERTNIANNLKQMNSQLGELASTVNTAQVVEQKVEAKEAVETPSAEPVSFKKPMAAASAATAGLGMSALGAYYLADNFGALARKDELANQLEFSKNFNATNKAAGDNVMVQFAGEEKAGVVSDIMSEMTEAPEGASSPLSSGRTVEEFMSIRAGQSIDETTAAYDRYFMKADQSGQIDWATPGEPIVQVVESPDVSTDVSTEELFTRTEVQLSDFEGAEVQLQDVTGVQPTKTLYAISYDPSEPFDVFMKESWKKVTISANGKMQTEIGDETYELEASVFDNTIENLDLAGNGLQTTFRFSEKDINNLSDDLPNGMAWETAVQEEYTERTNAYKGELSVNSENTLTIHSNVEVEMGGTPEVVPFSYEFVAIPNNGGSEAVPLKFTNTSDLTINTEEMVQYTPHSAPSSAGTGVTMISETGTVMSQFDIDQLNDETLVGAFENDIWLNVEDAEAVIARVEDIWEQTLWVSLPLILIGVTLLAFVFGCWCCSRKSEVVADPLV